MRKRSDRAPRFVVHQLIDKSFQVYDTHRQIYLIGNWATREEAEFIVEREKVEGL
jgi:hypothetical protein